MSMTIHFEIPADDLEQAKKFYSELSGLKITEVPGRTNYLLITTTGKQAVGGSIMKRQKTQQVITNYIYTSSVDECAAKVKILGGRIVVLKKVIPGTGYFAIYRDTENSIFCIWEENEKVQ